MSAFSLQLAAENTPVAGDGLAVHITYEKLRVQCCHQMVHPAGSVESHSSEQGSRVSNGMQGTKRNWVELHWQMQKYLS